MNASCHNFPASGPLPKVYSYSRFSTPEQAAGDSSRRQSDAALRWAQNKGLELDSSLSLADKGVSAYRGGNVEEDRGLGAFLFACREGLIEHGSYLLVESLDRISRMTPRRVQRLLDDIVDAGVTIVTLNDGQEYTADRLNNDPTALLIALMVSWRAHEESRTKGRRVAAAWAQKRRRVREGADTLLTRRAPPWLQWNGSGWTVDEGRADIVRRVYEMSIEGAGEHRIAAILNGEGIPPLGRGKMWHRSTISKLLRTSTVIGVLTPGHMSFEGGKKRRVLEDPIADAYPAIVSKEKWQTIRSIKDGSTAAVRGRGATAPLANVFAGLARCPDCGSAMTRVMKGTAKKGGRPKLVCTKAKAGAASHPYVSVWLPTVQDALKSDWQALMTPPAGDRGGLLDAERAGLETALHAAGERLEALAAAMKVNPSVTLAAKLQGAEAELVSLRAALKVAKAHQEATDGGLINARLGALQKLMEVEELELAPVNAVLRSLFDGVTIDHHHGRLEFHWKQGGVSGIVFAMAAAE